MSPTAVKQKAIIAPVGWQELISSDDFTDVLPAIPDGWSSVDQIQKKLKAPKTTVQTRLQNLDKAGKIASKLIMVAGDTHRIRIYKD